ncbi:DNA-invertase hin [Paenibacillus konkukensis]|uniref:DNA-invertase hin n=1 Tax=Paenibacillus konkukensis TaxID=2020716 RepID=A0ABY4RQ11_9BACL|nr:recombinase family protein [Paenibacillus konkukensis]UQZ84552.1 DNA-invertase hin [Paenibacillus konkukensis]
MNKTTVAIYARVSTEEQVKEGYSIQAQIAELKRYAELHGFQIVDEYVDEGASGKNITGRPQMKRLLKDAQHHRFLMVMVYKIDRLARKLKDALEISDTLENHNVKLISLNENFDTSTPFGKTAFQMLCSFAELERNNIIDRVKMGMMQRAKEGKYNGGKVLGYDNIEKELIVNEDEAIIVRKIFEYADQGLGLKAITRRLNEMGYRTKTGKAFAVFSIKTILNNPVYLGKIRYNQLENWADKRRKGKNSDFLLTDGTHQPLITIEQWERVHKVISKRSYKPIRSNTPYILSGLVKCPVCSHGMVPGRAKGAQGKPYRYYVCGQFHNKGKSVCRSNMIRADVVEQHVMNELARIVSEPYVLKKLVDKINSDRQNNEQPLKADKRTVESRITKVQTKIKSLKDNILTDPEIAEFFKPDLIESIREQKLLQERLESINTELTLLDMKPVDYESLKLLLSNLQTVLEQSTPDDQKALYRLLIKEIIITKDAPRGVGRQVKKINLHFDFTMDSLFSPSFEMLGKVKDHVAPLEASVLNSLYNINKQTMYRDLMESLSILPLAMIRFTLDYFI